MGGEGKRVVVVGASAAGLHAAALLSRGGCEVRVLERRPRLDPASRTLIVTSRMRDLLGSVAEGCVRNRIHRFELYADGLAASVSLASPDLVIERSALVRDLAEDARRAGASVEFGRRFLGIEPTRRALRLSVEGSRTGREDAEADVVVGADGAFSAVARGAGWPRQSTVPLLQALVDLPEGSEPGTSRVWFRPGDTSYFYWLVPESPRRGVVGVIGEDGPVMRERFDRFLEAKGFVPSAYQAARISAGDRVPHRRRMGSRSVFLVGDAAGQVKVSTVGGVVTGLRGARAAAAAIVGGDGRRETAALRRELAVHRAIRRVLHRFSEDDYRDLIGLLDERARRRLGEHTRDDAVRVVVGVLRARPALALLAVRALLGGVRSRVHDDRDRVSPTM